MAKKLMKGNVAIAEAAVQAGCRYYFGYPITPQNEVPEYLSKRIREVGGVFKQAESEVASINMVFGASAAGGRAMTSSSGLGIALMQEGISNLSATQIPAVILNVSRGGPGIGTIQAAQQDYMQMTRGGGNGDYHCLVYAPWDMQEACDLMQRAFDKADEYRMVAMVYTDATLSAMMESVEIKENAGSKELMENKPWALSPEAHEGGRNKIEAVWNEPKDCMAFNEMMKDKYDRVIANETMVDLIDVEDADFVIVAYGTTARIAQGALKYAKAEGVKVGMIRPVTLWPFPYEAVYEYTKNAKGILVAEMAINQLEEDVRMAVDHDRLILHLGTCGGVMPSAKEMAKVIVEVAKEVL